MYEIRCAAPVGDVCGEAALWSAEEQAVYWTDINRFLIHRLCPSDGNVKSWFFEEPVVALALTTEIGRMLVALGSKLIWWWPTTDRRQDHGFTLSGSPQVRLNDGRADPLGNFWIGSMRNNVLPNGEAKKTGGADGILFRVTPGGTVSEWMRDIGVSNTLCWSPDRSTFYTGDTRANTIYAFDYDDKHANIANRRPFFTDYERGSPDGSAIDADGFIWNCRYRGRSIVRVAPNGTIDRIIEMPVKNITTATFGGHDLKTLYVTTAAINSDPGDRLAGSLWAIDVETPGLPENTVALHS